MMSLTRGEYDAVSTALIEAWIEAARRDRLGAAGLRPKLPVQEPARPTPPAH